MEEEYKLSISDPACGWESKTFTVHSYKAAKRTVRYLRALYYLHFFGAKHTHADWTGKPKTPQDIP